MIKRRILCINVPYVDLNIAEIKKGKRQGGGRGRKRLRRATETIDRGRNRYISRVPETRTRDLRRPFLCFANLFLLSSSCFNRAIASLVSFAPQTIHRI